MANVKGSALASRILWVQLEHGDAGYQRLLGQISPELRQTIEMGVNKAKWYPFDQFIELNLVLDRLFGKGDLALIRELGRYGADANLKTIYRLFYKVGTVHWILGRAVRPFFYLPPDSRRERASAAAIASRSASLTARARP